MSEVLDAPVSVVGEAFQLGHDGVDDSFVYFGFNFPDFLVFPERLEDRLLEASAVDLVFGSTDPVYLCSYNLPPVFVHHLKSISDAIPAELGCLDLIHLNLSLLRSQDITSP